MNTPIAAGHLYPRIQLWLQWLSRRIALLPNIQVETLVSPGSMAFILGYIIKASPRCERWMMTGCSLTFLLGQRLHSPKTHTTPSRHKPTALNFQKKTCLSFSFNRSKRCILLSFHLLTGRQSLNPSEDEVNRTCHSTSGGRSHYACGIWL